MKINVGRLEIEWEKPGYIAWVVEFENPVWRTLLPLQTSGGPLSFTLQAVLASIAAGAKSFTLGGEPPESAIRAALVDELQRFEIGEGIRAMLDLTSLVVPELTTFSENVEQATGFFETAPRGN